MLTIPTTIKPKQWQVAPALPPALRQELAHLPAVLAQILYNRGLTSKAEVQAFLEGQYLRPTDPFLLADMSTAVERIARAIKDQEQIVVYGDFDADGVTSSVLLTEALRGLGAERNKVRPYIPDRVDEGYGLNNEALSKIKTEFGGNLVITVDCGIRSVQEVAHGRDIGLDMIVTDHHSIGPQLPPAHAIINPKRADSPYPETMLAGVGIAYKLAEALNQAITPNELNLPALLDLVAIGTVADIAPLVGENRQLVRDGLAILNGLQRPGLAALAQQAGLKAGYITAESIGFAIGPRLNAAGRLSHAYDAARLLSTNNLLMARPMADELNNLNRRRQQLTAELTAHAESLLTDTEAPLLFVADDQFVSGVVGLVASRLKENYYRPTIVLQRDGETSHGSCRSVAEFHITEALDQVGDLLVRYGGHAQAAGLTIRNELIPEFVARMTEITAVALADSDLRPTIPIDAELNLHELDWALYDILQQLEPTGAQNATPIFISRGAQVVHHRVVGQDQSHLQLEVSSGGANARSIRGIAFGQGGWARQMPAVVDLVYNISVNEWNGNRYLQLNIHDLRPSDGR
jgi:single-stranded-DNA-specific exonuclease